MVKLINNTFGTITYVAEERLEEYLSAGFKLAEDSPKETVKKESKPKKKATAKPEK